MYKLLLPLFLLSTISCTLTPDSTQAFTPSESINESQSVNEQPKARIVIARFRDKTAPGNHWWNPKIGDGMANQLTAALLQSGRFIVPDSKNLDQPSEKAELLVMADVTEFGDTSSHSKSGNGVLDAIGDAVKTSKITLNLRIIDSRTARILAETSIQGQSNDINLGAAIGDYFNGGDLAGALGEWKGTPTEQAFLSTIKEVVNFIVNKTPEQYYHFGNLQFLPIHANFVTVSTNKLNIRTGAGTQFKIVYSATRGERLEVLDANDKWLYIKATNGQKGWAARWLTSPAS